MSDLPDDVRLDLDRWAREEWQAEEEANALDEPPTLDDGSSE